MQTTTPKSKTTVLIAWAALLALGTAATSRPSIVQAAQATQPTSTNVLAGETEAKRMVLLMDRDKDGKVSKKEYMDYMEAEFERLDINHDGELDVKELTNYQFAPSHGTHR